MWCITARGVCECCRPAPECFYPNSAMRRIISIGKFLGTVCLQPIPSPDSRAPMAIPTFATQKCRWCPSALVAALWCLPGRSHSHAHWSVVPNVAMPTATCGAAVDCNRDRCSMSSPWLQWRVSSAASIGWGQANQRNPAWRTDLLGRPHLPFSCFLPDPNFILNHFALYIFFGCLR